MKCKCETEMEFIECVGIPCTHGGKEGYWSCPKCHDYWPAFWDADTKIPIDPTKPLIGKYGELLSREDIRHE